MEPNEKSPTARPRVFDGRMRLLAPADRGLWPLAWTVTGLALAMLPFWGKSRVPAEDFWAVALFLVVSLLVGAPCVLWARWRRAASITVEAATLRVSGRGGEFSIRADDISAVAGVVHQRDLSSTEAVYDVASVEAWPAGAELRIAIRGTFDAYGFTSPHNDELRRLVCQMLNCEASAEDDRLEHSRSLLVVLKDGKRTPAYIATAHRDERCVLKAVCDSEGSLCDLGALERLSLPLSKAAALVDVVDRLVARGMLAPHVPGVFEPTPLGQQAILGQRPQSF